MPTETPAYGTQAHGLIRFGKTWIKLDEVKAIEFDPEDGCGAECLFLNGQKSVWHIPHADALALRSYLEGFETSRKQVDEATTIPITSY